MIDKVRTPCIGVCSTGIGDAVCRGCKRFSYEIVSWNGYTDDERRSIMNRINTLLTQVVDKRVDVFDPELLQRQMQVQNIRFDPALSVQAWVFELLRAGANQILDIENYGCRILGNWRDLPLSELKKRIDDDFYTLSSLHYERYFMEFV